tara:strand:- start:2673 stop:2960 length:288 start_codon:yes stop_codon:yes gene_type:complete
MKIIKVEDVEIEFQKQNKGNDSKWCTYVKVRHKDHDKLLFMIKTDHKPYTRFTLEDGDITTEKFMASLNEQSALDISIQDEKSNPMPKPFHDKNN